VAAAPVVEAVAAAFEAEPVAVAAGATAAAFEAEPVAVAAGATAAAVAVVKKPGQIPLSKQLMRPDGHALRALTRTLGTQTNAVCAVHPTPERHRRDVKREAARALVMQARMNRMPLEWQQKWQQEYERQ